MIWSPFCYWDVLLTLSQWFKRKFWLNSRCKLLTISTLHSEFMLCIAEKLFFYLVTSDNLSIWSLLYCFDALLSSSPGFKRWHKVNKINKLFLLISQRFKRWHINKLFVNYLCIYIYIWQKVLYGPFRFLYCFKTLPQTSHKPLSFPTI